MLTKLTYFRPYNNGCLSTTGHPNDVLFHSLYMCPLRKGGGGGFYHYEKGVGVGKVLAMLKGGGGVTTSIGVVLTR